MRQISFFSFLLFLTGFVIGNFPVFVSKFHADPDTLRQKFMQFMTTKKVSNLALSDDELYDVSMSQDLFHEVKILCWVFTHPDNHRNKSVHIKNLWGKRCNKLLFISNEEDSVLGSIALPVPVGREELWNKTLLTYKYVRWAWSRIFLYDSYINFQVHEHHLDDADWFMRLDDDK